MKRTIVIDKDRLRYFITIMILIYASLLLFACNRAGGNSDDKAGGRSTPLPLISPILFYSSAKAGPNQGWEESPTKGAAITVWGKNIGTSRGTSAITVAGVTLNQSSDYAEWGATTNPATAKGMQRITFWLNSSMPEGNTEGIHVTVNGKKSNTLPFKIDNTGVIRFLSLAGSESYNGKYATYQGGVNGPWTNFGLTTSKMTPGDFLERRGGN